MRRGAALISVLFSLSLLAILGAAMLQRQRLAYAEAALSRQGLQALALAEAGLEDARIKLEKDGWFPPAGSPEQVRFSYSEELQWQGQTRGHYQVTIDHSRALAPCYLIRVEAWGFEAEQATRRGLVAEFDACPHRRGQPSQPNPEVYRLLRVTPLATP